MSWPYPKNMHATELDYFDPELVLKTTPPRLARGTHLRERLSSENIEFRDRAIVEIVAPAGFGKTSLLGQWRREALRRGKPVAWLTLDERDDGLRLARGLALAMRQASGRPGFERIITQSTQHATSEAESLTLWLAEVANLGAETLLILDEVQSAPSKTIEQALRYLLLNAPPNLRIALASRQRLDFQLTQLLACGQSCTIGVERMRLSLQETLAVLKARFYGRIGADDGIRLHDRIAGWPLGLQLAIATMEKSTRVGDFLDAMDSVSSDFEQYFLSTLVAGLEASAADFLERIAILDAICGELCLAVTGMEDAQALLDQLRAGLPIFIEGLDSDWMRLHPIAIDFLRARMERRPPDEVCALHERAARWLADHDMLEEAARHALAAGRNDLAYTLIGDCLHNVVMSGDHGRVLQWLDLMPAPALLRQPRILLGAGWALARSDRHGEAAEMVAKVDANAMATEDDRFEAALIRVSASYFGDRIDEAATMLAPWLSDWQPDALYLRIIKARVVATFKLYEGKPEQGRQIAQSACALWPKGVNAVRGSAEWLVGLSYLWEGQVQLAADYLRESLLRAEEALGRRAALSVTFASGLSAALWESGQTGEAMEVLTDRLDVLERLSYPESIALGYRTAARGAVANGKERRAFDLLENLFALGVRRNIPRFCVTALYEQIRQHALCARKESAETAGRRLESVVADWKVPPEGLLQPLLALRAAVARAYVALAAQDWDRMLAEALAAKALADRLRRGGEGIEIQLLTALARKRRGEEADQLLREALSLANTFGLKRNLCEERPDLFRWARDAEPATSVTDAQPPARPRAPEPAPARASSMRHSILLTAKEDEVLRLLATNLSNKQIAAALGVSADTVKWHIKNLFVKLDAGSRGHAVDRARMLGILDEQG